MIIIRKLLSLFLVLVVITSFSFTAFAAGEQPSGSSYNYPTTGGTSASGTYWYAVTQGLYNMSTWFAPLRLTSYRYYDGTSTASTGNLYTALSNSLYNIGANLRTNFTSLLSDTGTISSRISSTNSTLSTISSTQLPVNAGYTYDTASSTSSNNTYWTATSNQLVQIFRRLGFMKTSIENMESDIDGFSSDLTSINSSTSSIDTKSSTIVTNTGNIVNRLPTGNFGYINGSGEYVGASVSTYGFWRAVEADLYYGFHEVYQMSAKLPSGDSYWYVNGTGNQSRMNFWSAISTSVANMGSDIQLMKDNITDLHTMFASPEDLALKADQENNISAATSNFLSGSDSATSVGTGSIGKVKDLGDDAAAWFDTGVQATSLFDALSNDDTDDGPWMWFTQATMDDLDSTSNSRSTKSSSSPGEYVPDLYGAKMDELYRMLHTFSE